MNQEYNPQSEQQNNQNTASENTAERAQNYTENTYNGSSGAGTGAAGAQNGGTAPSAGAYVPPFTPFVPFGMTLNTLKEKNSIKKSALIIGLCLIVLSIISFFWATAYYFIAGLFGISQLEAYNMISEPAAMQVVQILISSFMFTVPFIIIYKGNGLRISDIVPLGKPKKGNRAAMFFFGVSFCAFANIAVSYASSFFDSFGVDYDVDFGENPQGIFGFLLSFTATVLVPGLVEEFANRGLILGILRKFGDGFAVVVSALIFGLLHGNFEQIPFAFLVGLVLGYIVVKSESLWLAVAVHAFNNFISVFFDYALASLSVTAQNIIYNVFLMLCLLSGIIALILTKRGTEDFKFDKSPTECTLKQKTKWFFSYPLIIIFIVFSILESLMYFVI